MVLCSCGKPKGSTLSAQKNHVKSLFHQQYLADVLQRRKQSTLKMNAAANQPELPLCASGPEIPSVVVAAPDPIPDPMLVDEAGPPEADAQPLADPVADPVDAGPAGIRAPAYGVFVSALLQVAQLTAIDSLERYNEAQQLASRVRRTLTADAQWAVVNAAKADVLLAGFLPSFFIKL